MPSEVKTSRRTLWGWRPSTTCACGTPASTARMHASSFGIIPASTRVSSSRAGSDPQLGQQRATVRPVRVDALDVGEDDELAGAERDGEGGRGRVGVDVEHLALVVEVRRDGRDDRDAARVEEVEDGPGVDLDDVADEPEVVLLAVDGHAAAAGAEEGGVLAGEADGDRPVLVEQADELATDLAGEHHPHDVHDLGRRDPQAAVELGLQAEPVEHRLDLRAAAVDDDRAQAGVAQEGDVLGEGAP